MNAVTVKAVWSEDLNTCTVTIARGLDAHTYYNLLVKKVNLRDWQEPQMTYTVKVPCETVLGHNLMVCFGRDAVYGYVHNERQPFVFTPLEDDEIIDIPQRKKGKKYAEYQQMLLFSAASEREAREGEV